MPTIKIHKTNRYALTFSTYTYHRDSQNASEHFDILNICPVRGFILTLTRKHTQIIFSHPATKQPKSPIDKATFKGRYEINGRGDRTRFNTCRLRQPKHTLGKNHPLHTHTFETSQKRETAPHNVVTLTTWPLRRVALVMDDNGPIKAPNDGVFREKNARRARGKKRVIKRKTNEWENNAENEDDSSESKHR